MTLTIIDLAVTLDRVSILKNLNLQVADGEYLALLGPSGSGKTTLLKSISGLIDQVQGAIQIDQVNIKEWQPDKRPVSVVFQDLRLFPHYNVYDNIAFALKLQKLPQKEIDQRVASLLEDVQLPGYQKVRVNQLSGGQQQRIALARSLASDPKVLLLDEPFSGLDEPLRREMGQLVYQLHQEKGMMTILVTHDKREAVAYADRIAFLQEGNLVQVADPQFIINHPRTHYLANFFGKMNELTGQVEKGCFRSGSLSIPCLNPQARIMMIRPNRIRLAASSDEAISGIQVEAQIEAMVQFPEYSEVTLRLLAENVVWTVNLTTLDPGLKLEDRVILSFQADDASFVE